MISWLLQFAALIAAFMSPLSSHTLVWCHPAHVQIFVFLDIFQCIFFVF